MSHTGRCLPGPCLASSLGPRHPCYMATSEALKRWTNGGHANNGSLCQLAEAALLRTGAADAAGTLVSHCARPPAPQQSQPMPRARPARRFLSPPFHAPCHIPGRCIMMRGARGPATNPAVLAVVQTGRAGTLLISAWGDAGKPGSSTPPSPPPLARSSATSSRRRLCRHRCGYAR